MGFVSFSQASLFSSSSRLFSSFTFLAGLCPNKFLKIHALSGKTTICKDLHRQEVTKDNAAATAIKNGFGRKELDSMKLTPPTIKQTGLFCLFVLSKQHIYQARFAHGFCGRSAPFDLPSHLHLLKRNRVDQSEQRRRFFCT